MPNQVNMLLLKFNKSKWIISLLFIFSVFFVKAEIDTSGVYISKADFISNTLQYKTFNSIRTPFFPVFARFIISREAFPLKIKINTNVKKLPSGSFYGFNNDGVKYLYIKKSDDYVAVINDIPPIYMIVQKKVHFSGTIAFADDIYLYTQNLDNPFKEFTIKNITEDFGYNKKAMDILLDLHKKIIKKGYDAEIHKKAFLKCRKMVEAYISKLKESPNE